MELHCQATNVVIVKPMWLVIQNLMGMAAGDVCVLSGDVMLEAELEQWRLVSENVYLWSHHYRMLLHYMFGRYERAEEFSVACRPLVEHPFGAIDVCLVLFIETLTALALEGQTPK